jgi:hypothetical protein
VFHSNYCYHADDEDDEDDINDDADDEVDWVMIQVKVQANDPMVQDDL